MPSTQMIAEHLEFMDTANPNLIIYLLKDHANGDTWKDILVIINGNTTAQTVKLPPGNWDLVANENKVQEKPLNKVITTGLTIPATALYILHN